MTSTDSNKGMFSPEGEKRLPCEHERFLSGHNSSNVATFKVNFRDFETPVSIITLRLWFPLSADTFQDVAFPGAVIFNSW